MTAWRRFPHSTLPAMGGLIALVLLATGCGRDTVQTLESAEAADAAMREAQAAQAAGEFDKAYELFKAVTISQPFNALAHLQLGIVLQDSRKDPITALSHFQTYLFLRPDAEKRDMVDERIRQAKLQISLEYRGGLETVSIVDERKQWEEQVAALKSELAEAQRRFASSEEELVAARAEKEKLVRELARLNKQVDTMLNNPDVSQPTPKDLAKIDLETDPSGGTSSVGFADRSVQRTYVVKRGDSLWSIAQRHYGDASRNKDIRDANRDVLRNGDQVEEGMVLVIPY
ncbi:MAG: LysM peptidoglycan-binding domain-containing protein [Kiritimatiellia bacterium]|jgi:tetratricopeptide (TPR) repeat protein